MDNYPGKYKEVIEIAVKEFTSIPSDEVKIKICRMWMSLYKPQRQKWQWYEVVNYMLDDGIPDDWIVLWENA